MIEKSINRLNLGSKDRSFVKLQTVDEGIQVLVVPRNDSCFYARVIGQKETGQIYNKAVVVKSELADYPFVLAGGTRVLITK